MFKIAPKTKPKWYAIRKQISRFLVWLARKIEPECPYTYAYFLEQMMKAQIDSMTYGTGAIEVKHVPFTNRTTPS